jgi:hypothetical protein
MKKYLLIVLLLLSVAVLSFAYPQPTKAKKAGIWTLKTEVTQPEQIYVNIPRKGNQRFWYIIVTVTNTTDEEVGFYPKCELVTDTFEVIIAGKHTPGFVSDKIKVRYEGSYPFLENLEAIDRRVLVGADNTKDIVIAWPDFDDDAKEVRLFLSGLSNETAKVEHPIQKDGDGTPVIIYLRKTLELDYSIGGDPLLRGQSRLVFKEKDWVMR